MKVVPVPLTVNGVSSWRGRDATEGHYGYIKKGLEANQLDNGVGGLGVTLQEPWDTVMSRE